LSLSLRQAHFQALLLVEILEQPMRMPKNERSVFYGENILIGLGPELT